MISNEMHRYGGENTGSKSTPQAETRQLLEPSSARNLLDPSGSGRTATLRTRGRP
ncbi:hypothetical protein CRUP_027734 [Coryphaenoides rupestris]|nr:hypothetical protein CRUP_027734 [Coryphaenoides rupestris]